MAGLAPISLQQFINPTTRRPYSGAKAYFFEASTNNLITVYSDYGLGTAHSNPVIADSQGRFAPIFIDEEVEFYGIRLTTSSGSVLPLGDGGNFDIPVLPVIGPTASAGGGSEVPVDPNALFTTGDTLWVPKTGTRTGWVRMNGRTVGSASSGASERANADTEDLYAFVWDNFADAICAVTGGRGISAAVDFAANKPIALLDMRSRGPFGLDDMGNSALSGFTGITFAKGNATTAGASGGASTKTLSEAEMPSHDHDLTDNGHTHTVYASVAAQAGSGVRAVTDSSGGSNVTSASATTSITMGTAGSSTAFDKLPPFMLGSWYQRL